jgi:HD-like signal output (HDOD) protein
MAQLANPSGCLERILEHTNELAVLPHVVHRVLELTSNEDTISHELERAIAVDPGFSSRLLVLANSAAFGLPRRITSIREAILFLGFRTIRSAALTVGVFDIFVGKTDRNSLRRREWWRHSVDTAVCARYLAKVTDKVPVEDAYTSGLLHLIGKMLLDKYGGRDYELVQKLEENGAPCAFAEEEVYGVNHSQVSSAAAASWNLPQALQSGLLILQPAPKDDPFGSLRACTVVASSMAARAKNGCQKEDACPPWALERLGLSNLSMSDLGAQARRVIAEAEMKF